MDGERLGRIRAARAAEVALLPAIEDRAAALYSAIGMPEVAAMAGVSTGALQAAREAGRLWIAADAADLPVGFAMVELVGGQPHLRELDVLPEHGRRGLGRRLLEQVLTWARASGFRRLSLTTFRDIPWNAPWYGRLGFEVVELADCSPTLRRQAEREAASVRAPRVVMALTLDGSPSPQRELP